MVICPVRMTGTTRNVSTTEAKAHLAELLRAVEYGQTVAITRHGQAIAHLVPARSRDREARRLAVGSFRKRRRQWRRVRMTSEEIVAAIHAGTRGREHGIALK